MKKRGGISGTAKIIGTNELTRFGIRFSLARSEDKLTAKTGVRRQACEARCIKSSNTIYSAGMSYKSGYTRHNYDRAGNIPRQIRPGCHQNPFTSKPICGDASNFFVSTF